jgi:hypothetical protein
MTGPSGAGDLGVGVAAPQHPARARRRAALELELHREPRHQRHRLGGDERAVGRQVADDAGEAAAERGTSASTRV